MLAKRRGRNSKKMMKMKMIIILKLCDEKILKQQKEMVVLSVHKCRNENDNTVLRKQHT